MKKESLLILTAIALTTSIALAKPTYAQQTSTTQDRETLIERLIKAFKLNETEVDKVVTTYRSERQAEMQKNFETKLNTLVSEGKITKEQKVKISAKHQEMQKTMPDPQKMQTMTQQEKRAQRDAKHAELEKWSQENGIELEYMFMFGRGKTGGGMGPRQYKGYE